MELTQQRAQRATNEILAWRKDSIFNIGRKRLGKTVLFGSWLCRWNNRVALAKYRPKPKD
jgi:hypothetical protein